MADNGKIDLAGLPYGLPGAFDTVAGVDTATGRAQQFPMPQAGEPKDYQTRAVLPSASSLPDGTAAHVNNDPNPENNGRWAVFGGQWVQSADRVTGLEGRFRSTQAKVDSDILSAVSVYDQAGRVEAIYDDAGVLRVLSTAFSGDEFRSYSLPENGLVPNQLNISDIRNMPVTPGLPDYMEVIFDSAGEMRVVKKISSTDSGAVFFGAAGSSLENIGNGAGIFSGAPAGIPQIRSIQGRGGLAAYTEGDVLVVDNVGASVVTPTEFDVFITAGQSNMVGMGSLEDAITLPAGVGFEWRHSTGALVPLADPLFASSSGKGSIHPAFAREYWLRTGRGVIVVPCAVEASGQTAAARPASNWDATGGLRALPVTRFNSCKAYLDANGYCWQLGGMLWGQGETDGGAINASTITKADYKAAFATMLSYFRSSISPTMRMVIMRTAINGADSTGYQQIRAAQMEFVQEHDLTYVYTGTLGFVPKGWLPDGLHYNQVALNDAGKKMASIASTVCSGAN